MSRPSIGRTRRRLLVGIGSGILALVVVLTMRGEDRRSDPSVSGPLLFLEGRAATPTGDGRALWPDVANGRVLVVGEGARVERVLQGSPPGGPPLTNPYAVVSVSDNIVAAEGDGRGLVFEAGAPARWIDVGTDGTIVASSAGSLIVTRTVDEVALTPVQRREPLLRIVDPTGKTIQAIGAVEVPSNALLGQVVNSGRVAPSPDGDLYFTFATQRELRRYRRDGTLVWRTTWPLTGQPPSPPTLVARNGSARPAYTLLQHAIAVGPEGLIYILGASDSTGVANRVFVFERDGTLARVIPVDGAAAIFAAGDKGVVSVARRRIAANETADDRIPFVPFVLPALAGTDSIKLRDYAGKVVIVNFWASWCGPCRREMPQLDALADRYDSTAVAVIGLNEDISPDAARRFLRQVGVDYPSGQGGGTLQPQYGYRGLPYTVILDRQLRIVKALYGFGENTDAIETIVQAELTR